VKETALLMTVQRIVGRVQIEDDPLGRGLVRLEEQLDEQSLDRRRIVADLVIAARSRRRMLKPVQCALAGERRTALTPGEELAGEGRQHGVVAQLIVIDQIFVAERDAENPLRHHGRDAVLDLRLGTAIGKTGRKPLDQPERPIGRAEQ
jgi:hypothetical protein